MGSSIERWEHIQTLFYEALELPESERPAFLRKECVDDPELMTEIESMLAADARQGGMFEQGLAHVAADLLDDIATGILRDLPGFRLIRWLGEGGSGLVYLAFDDDMQRNVAVKVLRDAHLSPLRRERFHREKKTLAQLAHPHIATLYQGLVTTDGTPVLVMEYVDGSNIVEYCESGQLSLKQRLLLFRSVCEAVMYAHSHAVVHRDIKPSNVMVNREGQTKLLDFGIAKQLDDEADLTTSTGLRMMTPAYAAPEQVLGETVGVYTDVYGLGVLLYELLAGVPAFDFRNVPTGQRAAAILNENPQLLSERWKKNANEGLGEVSQRSWEELGLICRLAMHKEPARRYQTVESLIRDIDAFLEGQPVSAKRDTLRYRASKFIRRNWTWVLAAASVTLLVTALVAYYTANLAHERDLARTEAAKAQMVSDFVVGLLETGDPFDNTEADVTVDTVLSRALLMIDDLADQPQVQAKLVDMLGRVYLNRGNLPLADSLLRHGLRMRSSPGSHPLDVADSYVNMGRLFANYGLADSALHFLNLGAAYRETHLEPGDPHLILVYNDLGTVYTQIGRYAEAEALLLKAKEQLEVRNDSTYAIDTNVLYNLAVAYGDQGKFHMAVPLYQQALAIDSVRKGGDHPKVSVVRMGLATSLAQLGEYVTAEYHYLESLRVLRLKLGDGHPTTIYSIILIGNFYRQMRGAFHRQSFFGTGFGRIRPPSRSKSFCDGNLAQDVEHGTA